ncbi:MAG: peptide deformylase [Bacteroidetes bacterium]|nr:peptide deformylase [Bacteroidota bacterium]MDA0875420.1 peptide deformylase [Bacteroidota bacterium]
MVLDITKIGHPVLREACRPVSLDELHSEAMQQFIDDLIETKRAANGAGIAAPQVGRAIRIFVVEVKNNPRYPYKPEAPLTICVNPELEFLTEERYLNYEGCLSIPDLRGQVPRCPHIRVKAWDRSGEPFERIVKGITAGTFQHEYDHIEGILFPDRSDPRSFCTWGEFALRQEPAFREHVQRVVAQWGE